MGEEKKVKVKLKVKLVHKSHHILLFIQLFILSKGDHGYKLYYLFTVTVFSFLASWNKFFPKR